jgi:hypothetical protein
MTRIPLFLLALLCSVSMLTFGCKAVGTEEDKDEDCNPDDALRVDGHKIVRYDPEDFFTLESPESSNDCEATYAFYFRWADPLRRIAEQPGHEEMPPLENMEKGFQPGGEFAYFPHGPAVYDPNGSPTFAGSYGKGWWMIVFSKGNKNSPYPTTRYYVRARLEPGKATTTDSTEIVCRIVSYPPKEAK